MTRAHAQSGRLVRAIIWANVAVAVVSLLCYTFGQKDVLRLVMPLSWSGLQAGHWWECFTYMWIHAQFEGMGVLHIVCNMMTLSPFGRTVESSLGSGAFIGIYLAGGCGGACGFVVECGLRRILMGPGGDFDPGMVGASAAVLGVVTAFSILHPQARISLLFLPFRIRASRFMVGFVLVSLVMIFIPSLQFIAHSAHIGGILGGWFWMRWILKYQATPSGLSQDDRWLRATQSGDGSDVEGLSIEALRRETDIVLDKLSQVGVEQLDARDRHILKRAQREFILRKNP